MDWIKINNSKFEEPLALFSIRKN